MIFWFNDFKLAKFRVQKKTRDQEFIPYNQICNKTYLKFMSTTFNKGIYYFEFTA